MKNVRHEVYCFVYEALSYGGLGTQSYIKLVKMLTDCIYDVSKSDVQTLTCKKDNIFIRLKNLSINKVKSVKGTNKTPSRQQLILLSKKPYNYHIEQV